MIKFSLCILLLVVVLAMISKYVWMGLEASYDRVQSMDDSLGINIIGEKDVTLSTNQLADSMIAELNQAFESNRGWLPENVTHNYYTAFVVESKKTVGDLAAAKQPTQRSSWIMDDCNADKLYNFLISPQGFLVIDPISPIEEHLKDATASFPIPKTNGWNNRGIMEVRQTIVTLFKYLSSPMEFITFNIAKHDEKSFVSKSVTFPPIPGRSQTSGGPPPTSGNKRVLNTFGFKIIDISASSECSSSQCCRVLSYDYASDFGFSPVLTHYINAKTFYPSLLDRLRKHFVGY